MRQVIYQSRSTGRKAADDAPSILRGARPFNGLNGITGLLLATGDRFMQVLEGPDASVSATMARIAADTRHQDIEVLADAPVERRAFADWAMAYRDAGHPAGLLEERLGQIIARAPAEIRSRFEAFAQG